tara:strand:+ start:158 stop:538 length:381 start_codon:yes stop_codon:yes gene_type:complete
MDIYSKEQKRDSITNWKRRGLIYDDYDDLFEVYRKTLVCQHCNKEFKNRHDRQLDHCHETGLFRKIVCQRCNDRDFYINHPDGIPTNKQEKIKCICGSIAMRCNMARHKTTPKHMKNMEVYMENID